MKIYEDAMGGTNNPLIVVLQKKECKDIVSGLESLLDKGTINKQSRAYKLLRFLEGELPCF